MTRPSSWFAPLFAAAVGAVALVPPTPALAAASVPAVRLAGVSDHLDALFVLPGERVALRTKDAKGRSLSVRWSASGAGAPVPSGSGLAVWKAPLRSGVYRLTAAGPGGTSRALSAVVTVPVGNVSNGKLNGYPIGSYPKGFGRGSAMVASRALRSSYDVPLGFIELTAASAGLRLSEHYKAGDFAGKDTAVGGKKYLFINPKLVEKLERATDMLRARGYAVSKLEVMSAYRSPWLNRAIGNTTTLSRHTYGDAADVHAVDFNRDGRMDRADADILAGVFDELDRTTDLTGGLHLYPPTPAHGYFVHTDTRGASARW